MMPLPLMTRVWGSGRPGKKTVTSVLAFTYLPETRTAPWDSKGSISIGGVALAATPGASAVAVAVAKTNISRNRIGRAVELSNSPVEKIRGRFSIVVANLTAETIIDLGRSLQKRLRPDGYMVLSGILNRKAPEVMRFLTSCRRRLVRQKSEKGWSTLLLEKKR